MTAAVPSAPRVRPAKPASSKLRILAVVVIVLGAIAFLVFKGLGDATVYFKTADEAVAEKESLGERRFRVEGAVVTDSVEQAGDVVEFEIISAGVTVPVVHRGDPPELFRPGIPVVLEGNWDGDVYASDRIMVKHTTEYREQNPDRVDQYVGKERVEADSVTPSLLGQGAVLLGFLAAAIGAITLAVGLVGDRPALRSTANRFTWLIVGAAVFAVGVMERALLTNDFSLEFVANHSARATPLLYKIATMWSALEGSILLWGFVLAGFLAVMTVRFRDRRDDPLVGWALLTAFVVTAFFFGLMVGPANPFRAVMGDIPADGPGPNPLLQNHPLMAIHPPMLYLGYVGFTIPFAFAIAALVTGRVGEGWLVETRRWTLFAWGFLSLGIVLGAWWSYEVLGWGGFWAWDPVENASFLPWLTGTAYLHSVMVQERRGMLRVWNLSLLVATFSLTILGTFLTRSGVLDSVHAFTESPIGPAILAFFGVTVIVSIGLIGWRGDELRSPGSIDSPLSREGAFLANNVVFAAFAFIVLLGTVFPLIVEAINGNRISVGRPYFDRMTMPVGLVLLFLMAVAPVLPWRKASGELLRTRLHWPAWTGTACLGLAVVVGARGLAPLLAFGLGGFAAGAALRQIALAVRRQGAVGFVGRTNGGMIVHLGVILIGVAFAASSAYGARTEVRLRPGETVQVLGHEIAYEGVVSRTYPNRTSVEAKVRVDGGKVYRPSISNYPFATQTIGTPSVKTGLREDVYLTLVVSPQRAQDVAVIGVNVQPLVVWLWIGGGLIGLGSALAAVPTRRRRDPRGSAGAPGTTSPVDAPAGDAAREPAVVGSPS